MKRLLMTQESNTDVIGGGLFIRHGFATVIDEESIDGNCWINQQVTIGYPGTEHPVIEDGCYIYADANAVVVKDVPENTVVAGVLTKIIKTKVDIK
jgi:serine O-acetyltransferase